jgi:DNA-binding NarL/FixJ family response regulator
VDRRAVALDRGNERRGGQVSAIRIVVGKTPRLLGEIIVAALSAEKGMRIVGEADNEVDLVDLCSRAQPDVVVLGSTRADVEVIGHRLLRKCPFAKLLALASDGRTTYLFELRPYKVELGALSPRDLVQAVLAAIQRPAEPGT